MEANWSFVIPNFPKNNNSQQIQDNSNRDHNLWTVSQNTVWNVEHSNIIWRSLICFPDKVFMVWSLSSWWLCGDFTWIFHWFAWWHRCWPGFNEPTCKHGCEKLHTAGWQNTNRYLSTNLWKVSQHQPRTSFLTCLTQCSDFWRNSSLPPTGVTVLLLHLSLQPKAIKLWWKRKHLLSKFPANSKMFLHL